MPGYASAGHAGLQLVSPGRGGQALSGRPEITADEQLPDSGASIDCLGMLTGYTLRSYGLGCRLLLLPALREWLPRDHQAYFISDSAELSGHQAITIRFQIA